MEPQDFTRRLLRWSADAGRRHLPWQQDPTPYRVWVSEIMLQQTQVNTVIPFYQRFMARFPDVPSLASAPVDEVLHLWTGLGYYARARNLHSAAKMIMQGHAGVFPGSLDQLRELPGIGRSTAGAILALSRGQRDAILDGNVKRVLSRVFGIEGDPSKAGTLDRLWQQAEQCTPTSQVAEYTQGIMDLGAMVCTRSRPRCSSCPMNPGCIAARDGRQADLPSPRRPRERPSREVTLLLAESRAQGIRAVLLERRAESGVWGGLWSPPQFENREAALAWCRRELGEPASLPEPLPPIDHAFTHFDLRLHPLRVRCNLVARVDEGTHLWYTLATPPRIGLPKPIKTLMERLED